MLPIYTEAEVRAATNQFFDNDELATDTIINKYLLKDRDGNLREKSPLDMYRRMAHEFARIEADYLESLDEDTIYGYFVNQTIMPQGSPSYGIGNPFQLSSLSNCVVVDSPEDSISGIMDKGKELANLFKRRCGVGIDISTLRPENATVSNSAGSSTGAWSFADFYSYVCRLIGQAGRRGALMITIDIKHPDARQFILMKKDKSKVTGANVSVKLSDEFMQAVVHDTTYTQQWPCTGTPVYKQEIRAKDLWDELVKAATESAEPGLLMWDNCRKYLPAERYSAYGFGSITTNPCAEIILSPYDSCRLICLNLLNMVDNPFTNHAEFNFGRWRKTVKVAMRLSDDLVDLELEKLRAIYTKVDTEDEKQLWEKLIWACENGRRTGLGTLGLADCLAALQLSYGSTKAILVTEEIYRTLKNTAYAESVQLSKERGPFPLYNPELEVDHPFLSTLNEPTLEQMYRYGRRNISILTNAPTGSKAIEARVNSGIEPFFRVEYDRRKKINHNSDAVPDYIDAQGDKWQTFHVVDHSLKRYREITGNTDTPSYFVCSDQLDWQQRIMMQQAIQQHIDHSISSTINLPRGTSPEVVGGIYMEAWRRGLKGVTVYVDGSRDGVLITNETKPASNDSAVKRPTELPCGIHKAEVGDNEWTFLIGLLDGKPYEVFGGLSETIDIPEGINVGRIIKHSYKTVPTRYELVVGRDGIRIKNITRTFDNPTEGTLTRMVSTSLRHGVPVQFIVEQLQKDDRNSDMFSFSRVLARVLKHYVKDGTTHTKPCAECGGKLEYRDGCVQCSDCGWSKCG